MPPAPRAVRMSYGPRRVPDCKITAEFLVLPVPAFLAYRQFVALVRAGALHTKFAASFVLPTPLYCATCGYGQIGRVMSTRLPATRDAINWSGAAFDSRQRSSAAM